MLTEHRARLLEILARLDQLETGAGEILWATIKLRKGKCAVMGAGLNLPAALNPFANQPIVFDLAGFGAVGAKIE